MSGFSSFLVFFPHFHWFYCFLSSLLDFTGCYWILTSSPGYLLILLFFMGLTIGLMWNFRNFSLVFSVFLNFKLVLLGFATMQIIWCSAGRRIIGLDSKLLEILVPYRLAFSFSRGRCNFYPPPSPAPGPTLLRGRFFLSSLSLLSRKHGIQLRDISIELLESTSRRGGGPAEFPAWCFHPPANSLKPRRENFPPLLPKWNTSEFRSQQRNRNTHLQIGSF